MNNLEKIAALKSARDQIKELDKRKMMVYEQTKIALGLVPMFDSAIWDYVMNGLQFLRHDLADALKHRENHIDKENYDRQYDDLW